MPDTFLVTRPQRYALLLAVPLVLATSVRGFGQEPMAAAQATYEEDVGKMILGGAGFGALGWAAGALLGSALWSGCDTQDCHLDGLFIGGAIGGTLGMANGVNLGNDRRGSFGLDLLAAAVVWGGGIFLASKLEDTDMQGATFLFIPIVQLGVTISAEETVAKRRFESGNLSLHLVPGPDRGLALAASARF